MLKRDLYLMVKVYTKQKVKYILSDYIIPPPKVDNAVVMESYQSEYLSGSERVEYMCQNYYTMEGEPYRTCINGTWTGQMRCLSKEHMLEFRYNDLKKMYAAHNGVIEFGCAKRRPVGTKCIGKNIKIFSEEKNTR
uniref:Sushi domain-containing protein n=1 Tax=Anabas testudineus TaxID=64144 RepID=A0A7N5ZTG5_ANATE